MTVFVLYSLLCTFPLFFVIILQVIMNCRKWISSKDMLIVSDMFYMSYPIWVEGNKIYIYPPINKLLKTTVKLLFSSLPDVCVCMYVSEHLVGITDLSYKLILSVNSTLKTFFYFFRWTELCPMIEARKNHGLVFVKDKIFAVGGQNGLGVWC